jgi:hypothetical protein
VKAERKPSAKEEGKMTIAFSSKKIQSGIDTF